MGGCLSNHASSQDTGKLVLQILAEVNTIPATPTTQPQQWRRLFHSLVPVSLTITQEEESGVFVYTVSASGVDGSTFSAHIRVPGTELQKTSPCFIQWCESSRTRREGEGERTDEAEEEEEGESERKVEEEEDGNMWGLNFISPEDAMKFLKGCTPPTFSPESRKKRWSIPVTSHLIRPPPPPPSQDGDLANRMSIDSFESVESSDDDDHNDQTNRAFDSQSPVPDSNTPHETHTYSLPNGASTKESETKTVMQSDADTSIPPDHSLTHTTPSTIEQNGHLHHHCNDTTPTNEPTTTDEPNTEEKAEESIAVVSVDKEREDTREDDNSKNGVTREEEKEMERGGERKRKSALFDVEGDSDENDDPTAHALYTSPTPLQLMPTGILNDIVEEAEGDIECEEDKEGVEGGEGGEGGGGEVGGGGEGKGGGGIIGMEADEDIEYGETEFFDAVETVDVSQTSYQQNQHVEHPPEGVTPPPPLPSFPVSPPPGPVLSPRLSMLTAETNENEGYHTPPIEIRSRQSVASMAGDSPPPPLPMSLPPGKLISPRHSLMDSNPYRPSSILGGIESKLDLVIISRKEQNTPDLQTPTSQLPNSTLDTPVLNKDESRLSNLTDEESLLITNIDEVDDPDEEELDQSATDILPPPMEEEEEEKEEESQNYLVAQKLKMTPSFLRSLEPPKEFSDSGFPDTDHLSTPDPGGRNGSSTGSEGRTTEYSGGSLSRNHTSAKEGSVEEVEEVEEEKREEERDDDHQKSSSDISHSESRDKTKREKETTESPEIHSTIRKTGWLELKTMLVRKNRKVAMKSKRKWRKFWAMLKGSALLFADCEDEGSLSNEPDDMAIDTRLDLSHSLAHAVHDHVKRDYIFCLSTANGNTYYLQTTSVPEMEEWIANIHCAAALAMTNHTSKEEAMQIIKSEIEEHSKAIEKETQMRNLTELNMATVTDYNARSMASKQTLIVDLGCHIFSHLIQISTCSENIEKHHVDIYRLRCYLASLQGSELPNPQTLLASIARPTKLALGKLGVFSVASLHAIVSARGIPSSTSSQGGFKFTKNLRSPLSPPGKGKGHKSKIFQKTGADKRSALRKKEISGPYPAVLSNPVLHSLAQSYSEMDDTTDTDAPSSFSPEPISLLSPVIKVITPGNRVVSVPHRDDSTITDLLHTACRLRQVDVRDHFIRLRIERDDGEFECDIPGQNELLDDRVYTHIELCQKWNHTVFLSQPDTHQSFGLTLEPVWDIGGSRLETVLVSRVEEGGVADHCGVWEGDEVTKVNGREVREAGWVGTRSSLDAPTVSLSLKTCHIEMPVSELTNQIVENLICPAPPTNNAELSPEAIKQLTVPTPSRDDSDKRKKRYSGTFSREHITSLLKDSNELSRLLKSWDIQQRVNEEKPVTWTSQDRLRKSIQDLLDTERGYIRLLHLLVEQYLDPLQSESILPPNDLTDLEGNTRRVLQFQTTFLRELEDAMKHDNNVSDNGTPSEDSSCLKNVVMAVAEAFLIHMDSFRLYSTFCASHSKIKLLLESGEYKTELRDFLEARNPHNDHSLSLPALFAKPIVRLSRYPLFLNAMIENSPANSEETTILTGVVDGMGGVANYINEMQRLSETYSALFHTILSENTSISPPGLSLSVAQLLYHGDVMWLNRSEDQRLGRVTHWKKGQGPLTICFVFSSAIVLVCVDKKLKRKASTKSLDMEVAVEETKFRILLPSLYCSVQDLPDSDGVIDMWQLKYRPPLTPVNGSPSLSSPPSTLPQNISYILRSQSTEQKERMVQLISQSIHESKDRVGEDSPLLLSPLFTSSPLTHRHLSPPPSHPHRHYPSRHQTHSSPRHTPTRPRSNSQPHIHTPSPHPSPLMYSHLPS